MHENLKYSFVLDQNIKKFETFERGDISIEDFRDQINDWQPIYAGNQYGTHFLIYAKILGKKENAKFIVDEIQIYIQNYSGSNTLGFNDLCGFDIMEIDINDPIRDARRENQAFFKFDIGLQGFNNNNVIRSFPLDKIELKPYDIIFTLPFFTPFDPNISKIFDSDSRDSSVFIDELFMKREGDSIYVSECGKKSINEIQANYNVFTPEQIDSLEEQKNHKVKRFSGGNQGDRMTNVRSLLGPVYPCIPAYSICFCP